MRRRNYKFAKQQQPSLTSEERERIELCRKGYDETAAAQSALLDKTIIAISGAVFTIAMGFIDKVVPLVSAKHIWVLWTALGILGLTTVVTTLSFWAGEKSAKKWRGACDNAEKNNDYKLFYEAKNCWATTVEWLNIIRLLFFVFGMLMLAGFISYNGIARDTIQLQKQEVNAMTEEKDKSQPKKTQPEQKPPLTPGNEGYNPSPPPPSPTLKPAPTKNKQCSTTRHNI